MSAPSTRRRSAAGASRRGATLHTAISAAHLAGIPEEAVLHYWRQGLVSARAVARRKPLFDDDALYELRRIEHYRQRFGASARALALISGLLREVARLEAEVRFLRD